MKTLVTNARIQSLNPCKDRLDNYLKFYVSNSHTKGQFMGLKNITHEDKLWVAFRLMPLKSLPLAAADIAESVLYLWEREYPQDLRPRKAIEAARSGIDCASASSSYAASSDANASASRYASYATASNYAAHAAFAAATHAASTNAYTYDPTNAYAAAYATCAYASLVRIVSPENKFTQEKLIRKIILKYWK